MAFIRLYEKGDFEAMAHICRETLNPGLASSPEGWVLAPYLWTHQYTHLFPSACFVLDDGAGTAVGYCIGCPDVAAFVTEYPSYTAAVLDKSAEVQELRFRGDHDPLAPAAAEEPWATADGSVNAACLIQLAYDPDRLLSVSPAVAARFPATLHIDLLEPWQRKGWGSKLLERTVGALSQHQQQQQQQKQQVGGEGRAGGGVWVGVAADNAKVVPFYERMGFRPGEDNVNKGAILLVREFPRA
ncbi:hypothetical protein BGZ63DRAFT_401764 [Mariannaea sp. PMI_226]|nr:hypothetical protein BGZ63DRAFT_401764 [Mariannaea sp. PMI_226]